jgi:RNA polymerase sigma-70 factor (ECF subfamily)
MGIDFAKQVIVSEYARKFIRFKAKQLSERSGFTQSDREDIEQDLALYLFTKARSFEPERASINTFISCVVNTGAAIIIRKRSRLCRNPDREVQSLAESADCDGREQRSLSETIGPDDLSRRTGCWPEDPHVAIQRRESIQHALRLLPADVREICIRLMDGNVLSVARDLGISRRRVRQAIEVAKPYFEEAGLSKTFE